MAGSLLLFAHLEKTRQGRDVGKSSFLRDEAADLDVGIEPFADAAKELQDELVAVDDGSIALFSS